MGQHIAKRHDQMAVGYSREHPWRGFAKLPQCVSSNFELALDGRLAEGVAKVRVERRVPMNVPTRRSASSANSR